MERLYTIEEVVTLTHLSPSTIYAQMDRGEFPRPKKISRNRVAWRGSDLEKWTESLADAKR